VLATQTSAPPASLPQPQVSPGRTMKMKAHAVRFPDAIFHFEIPEDLKLDPGSPIQHITTEADYHKNKDLWESKSTLWHFSYPIVNISWVLRSFFWQGRGGILNFSVKLKVPVDAYKGDVRDFEKLAAFINDPSLRGKDFSPFAYELKTINGHQWIHELPGEGAKQQSQYHVHDYLIPLSSRVLLCVNVSVAQGFSGDSLSDKWRQVGLEAERAILDSLRLEFMASGSGGK
jgi:hypothetical protein